MSGHVRRPTAHGPVDGPHRRGAEGPRHELHRACGEVDRRWSHTAHLPSACPPACLQTSVGLTVSARTLITTSTDSRQIQSAPPKSESRFEHGMLRRSTHHACIDGERERSTEERAMIGAQPWEKTCISLKFERGPNHLLKLSAQKGIAQNMVMMVLSLKAGP